MRKLHQKPEGVPKYRGVTWDAKMGKWSCRIMVCGEYYFLGWFSDPSLAACFYDRFKVRAADSFGRLQRKAKTNADLGLIPPLTLKVLDYLDKLENEASANKGRADGCFFPNMPRLFN